MRSEVERSAGKAVESGAHGNPAKCRVLRGGWPRRNGSEGERKPRLLAGASRLGERGISSGEDWMGIVTATRGV